MRKAGFLSIGWCLISGIAITSPIQAEKPEFNEIVTGFIAKAEKDSRYIGDNYRHRESEVTEDIKGGIVAKKEQETYLVEKREGRLFKKLILRNNVEIANADFQAKKELLSVGIRLLARYDFAFQRVEAGDKPGGERSLVFSFRPKANLPEGGMEERAWNYLAGEVCMGQETLIFKGLTAHITSEVNYALPGFLGGKLKAINCVIRTESIEGHFAIDFVRIEYQYSARMLGWPKNGHFIRTVFYQNYERRGR